MISSKHDLFSNLRILRLLVANAPASFSELAAEAGLPYTEESASWGTRYVIDFANLSAANQNSPLVRQLVAIKATQSEFDQISLETK